MSTRQAHNSGDDEMVIPPVPAGPAPGAGVDGQRIADALNWSKECTEEVERRGELQPCEKPAVALRLDPEEGLPYAVCSRHARADMVPLASLADALHAARAALAERDALQQRQEAVEKRLAEWQDNLGDRQMLEVGWVVSEVRRLFADPTSLPPNVSVPVVSGTEDEK